MALPMTNDPLAFFGQVAWQERGGGWWTVLSVSVGVTLALGVLAGIFWLNLYAVRAELEPRRRELETVLRPCSQYLGNLRRLGYRNRTMIDAT